MGLIAPLFLAGLAALSLPLLFHLIRRTPRGRQAFSSLMFLTPSPPRLTRRSRLDNLLLLLLRVAALALIALAFARPFLRETAVLRLDDLARRRVAILVDNSASMRRGDLWQQAQREAERVLADLGPADDIALFSFDNHLHTIVNFEDESAEPTKNKLALVRGELAKLKPSWGATDIGTSLVAIASELEVASDVRKSPAEPHLVLITDLQRGAKLEALQAYTWPDNLHLEAIVVQPADASNASAQLLVDAEQAENAEPRVRVANSAGSSADQFFVRWADGKSVAKKATAAKNVSTKEPAKSDEPLAIYIPPGQSRVVRLPRPAGALATDRILLSGDKCAFDNTFYVVPPRQQEFGLAYIGSDAADDPQGLVYYLQRALASDSLRTVKLTTHLADKPLVPPGTPPPKLVVVSQVLAPALATELQKYLERGGTALIVLKQADALASLGGLFDDLKLATEEKSAEPARIEGEYAMLGEIDFTHPLFVSFANSPYSDFTKIHFWKHRPLALNESATSRVVAKFDNGNPAIIERTVGSGRAYLLTSGWHPDDSQLAVSSKFVPLIQALLDEAIGGELPVSTATVGQSVPLSLGSGAVTRIVQKPDGKRVTLASDAEEFTETDEPGLYRVERGSDISQFAVNLASSESNTAPLAVEQLEQLGVHLGKPLSRAEQLKQMRQQRDTELESRQKIWRWLIVTALGILILETWVAGRTARSIQQAVPPTGIPPAASPTDTPQTEESVR
jgi:hypothetical protein